MYTFLLFFDVSSTYHCRPMAKWYPIRSRRTPLLMWSAWMIFMTWQWWAQMDCAKGQQVPVQSGLGQRFNRTALGYVQHCDAWCNASLDEHITIWTFAIFQGARMPLPPLRLAYPLAIPCSWPITACTAIYCQAVPLSQRPGMPSR